MGNSVKNAVLWNTVGTFTPVVAAAASIPPLINSLGESRFGILTLAWAIVGYFNIFDLGISRALTHQVSAYISAGKSSQLSTTIRTGIYLLTGIGLASAIILILGSHIIAYRLLSIPDTIREESFYTFLLLGASTPIVVITGGLRGALEGAYRFDIVNLIRLPMGTLTYLSPLLVLPFYQQLPPIVAALVMIRAVSLVAYLYYCFKLFPPSLTQFTRTRSEAIHLLRLGGWFSVGNLVGPILLHSGRFVIASLISVEAVAYFSTSYEAAAVLLIVPGVFVSALFPIFTSTIIQNPTHIRHIYYRWQVYIFVTMLPLCLAAIILVRPIFSIWISPDFASHSYKIAQLLFVGVFINCFGHISQCLIQSYGRPDISAKLQIIELILYIPYLVAFTSYAGAEGAAAAWTLRMSISTVLLAILSQLCLNGKIYSLKASNSNEPFRRN